MGGGQQEIIVNRGNGDEIIDTDVLRPVNSVNEVYNPTRIDTTGARTRLKSQVQFQASLHP